MKAKELRLGIHVEQAESSELITERISIVVGSDIKTWDRRVPENETEQTGTMIRN